MISIPGYQIREQIYESHNSLVYRGCRTQTNQAVILKVLKQEYPTPDQLSRYRNEFDILSNLNLQGVVEAYSLDKYRNQLVISLEDFGGKSLILWQADGKFQLEEFLIVAVQVAEALGQLHQKNIIHKDINPANIIWNPALQRAKIIDLGISSKLSRDGLPVGALSNPTIQNPGVLEGTLAYMSPEQTGRMNRSLDYRTDFYSLGVTFYELLSGQLPFESDDALELVHCHIAKQPVPPHQINPEIPLVISDIIMKLLAKTAEERYQSAWGIKADLESCLTQLRERGQITPFGLASMDMADKFQIPSKLYGREQEVQRLLSAFERVAAGQSQMMLIAGDSGVGKSTLVQQIVKPIIQQGGYFIRGKFDQFQRNVPYSALVSAFSDLVRQLLTESEARLNQWREALLAAFGSNGQLIIDVIPEVELIVGPQPEVQEAPTDAHGLHLAALENRFHLLFQNFMHVFCQPEHPFVIFLHDLQWADSATLKLLEVMMSDEQTRNGSLFLIGTYRDHHISASDPLMTTLEALRKDGAIINQMRLGPLTEAHISELIADTLHRPQEAVNPLAKLVLRKTGGNPFFVSEFLKTLYQEKLLTFDFDALRWQWDVEQVEGISITDNVVELMIHKVKQLPQTAQELLPLAACVGNPFDLNTLSIIHQKSLSDTLGDLNAAIQEGLILPVSEVSVQEVDSQPFIINYQFQHDRVQQAAYALMDDAQKKAIHLSIGRHLLSHMPADERVEHIFDLVDHLNQGLKLIGDDQELVELVRLNLTAGKKAKDATAYAAGREYLVAAMACLPEDSWENNYDLMMEVHKERANLEYLTGNFEQSQELIQEALINAHSAPEQADIFYLLIVQCTLLGKYEAAIQAGRNALGLLRVHLPHDNYEEHLKSFLFKINDKLPTTAISSLVDKREILNPKGRMAMRVLASMIPTAIILDRHLFGLITAKATYFSLAHGHVPESGGIYSAYAQLLASWDGYRSAYEFGLLSLKLSEKYNDLSQKCKSCQAIVAHLNHWVKPLKSSYAITNDGCQAGMQAGEFQYVGYSFVYELLSLFYQGANLEQTFAKVSEYLSFCQETRNQFAVDVLKGAQLAISAFIGFGEQNMPPGGARHANSIALQPASTASYSPSAQEGSWGMKGFRLLDEMDYLNNCEANQNMTALCIYYTLKQQILYLSGEMKEALEVALKAQEQLASIPAVISVAEHNFYYSLTLAALYENVSSKKQRQYWHQIVENQRQLRIWADHCPQNFLNMYLLVGAEMARISKKDVEAMGLYDEAIESARENEFIQHEALGNELAALFWLSKGKKKFAKLYLTEAHYGYQQWGAKRKAQDLKEKHGHLLIRSSSPTHAIGSRLSKISTSSRLDEGLDLATVMKGSQAISGEIVLDDLLSKMIKIVIENAGAQRGVLILEQDGEWVIEAEGTIVQEEVQESLSLGATLQGTSEAPYTALPTTIINYVARTGEHVVLSDATHEAPFGALAPSVGYSLSEDPYIKVNQPKSILCTPLINQGKLMGMLYLENNLIAGAFTPQRLEMLNLLSTQAAISIENARLYHTLEEKVDERTAQLGKANEEIQGLNERLKAENTRLEAEVNVVRKLQQLILPTEDELQQVEGLDIAAFMEAADEVGGDYLDVLQHNGHVKIGIGDVTGHGLESGVLMLMTQMGVRTLLTNQEADPARFMSVLNRTIYDNVQRMQTNKSLTLALLDYDPAPILGDNSRQYPKSSSASRLTLSGQHEELIVVRKGGQIELIDTFDLGFPIGLDDDISDFVDSLTVHLQAGDGVVLYTDGITEAENMHGEQYELERLCEIVSRHWHKEAKAIKNAVIAHLRAFIGQQKVHDDITLLVLKQK